MATYNVDSFSSQIAARGIASPNKFEVYSKKRQEDVTNEV